MQRLLIVEGEEDKKFFEAVLRVSGHPEMVDIHFHPSGKSNAIQVFAAKLELLTRASRARVGLAIDADDPDLNASDGFANTQKAVNQHLIARGFNALVTGAGTTGFLSRANSRPDLLTGLWVMPDNGSNGYLEDFARSVVATSEADRALYALNSTKSILENSHGGPRFSFKAHHLPKASIGAWLAWSDPPRMNLGTAVSRGLLDIQAAKFQPLISWLNLLYFS
jgi:hypothetical protein